MNSRLHYPKPDETWQSVIATYLRDWPRASRWRCAKRLLGSATSPVAYDYPKDIHRTVENLPSEFKLSSESVLIDHTLLPLHRPFLSPQRWKETVEAALANVHLHFTLGIGPSRIPQIKRLRICPQCVRNDINAWGCAYWHRIHQLPGALVCACDGAILIETQVLAHRNGAFELVAASDAELMTHPRISKREQIVSAKIAKDFQSLLSPDCPAPGLPRLQAAYLIELNKRGFVTVPGRIKNADLCQSFIEYFGKQFLNSIGCQIDAKRRDHWLLRLVRGTRGHQAPLRHVLLMQYLRYEAPAFMKLAYHVPQLVAPTTQKRLLTIHPRVTKDEIEIKQRAWLEICSRETGDRRQKHDALYSWLWRNSRKWLLTEGRFNDILDDGL